MRIVFIGTVEFSYKTLEKLISMNANIVGVCTKEESSFNSDFANLVPLCQEKKIPFTFVNDINSTETISWIKNLAPDIIFCFGWSSLIKKELLSIPPMGVIGYHPAALPKNRGRHPLIWAIALGLEKSASTFFFMDEGADSGDVLSQKEFDILYSDDASLVYKKLISTALFQLEEFLPKLQNKTFKKSPQNHSKSNYWRKRGKSDGLIDFRMSSKSIYNLVRALTKPYVGAHLEYQKEDIKIWKVEEVETSEKNIEAGKVLDVLEEIIVVKTSDKAIKIIDHEFAKLPKIGEYL